MNRYIQINIIFPGDQAVEAPTQGYDEGGSENRLLNVYRQHRSLHTHFSVCPTFKSCSNQA